MTRARHIAVGAKNCYAGSERVAVESGEGGRGTNIVYDESQHRDLFNGPGGYLFRGTLRSSAFGSAYQGTGVTPTSVDPIVATLFACQRVTQGPAVVLVALKSDFRDLLDGPNLACFSYECAVNIELSPSEFETRCRHCFSVHDSLAALDQLGYRLPSKLPDIGALALALTQSPRMPWEDIVRYVERCRQMPEGA